MMILVEINRVLHYELFCRDRDCVRSCETFCGVDSTDSYIVGNYREENVCPICKPFIIMAELAR